MRSSISHSLVLLSLPATLLHANVAHGQEAPAAAEPTEPQGESTLPAQPQAPLPTEPVAAEMTAPGADRPPAALPAAPLTSPPMMSAGGGIEAYWFSSKDNASTVPMIPYARFALSGNVLLDLHVPFSLSSNTGGEKSGGTIGNPSLGVTYVTTSGPTTWHIGGRVGIPLAGSGHSERAQVASALAAASMAYYDLHFWFPETLPIGLRLGFEHAPKRGLFLRGSLDPTLYVPAGGDSTAQRETLLLYQARVELEARSDAGWGGGLGVQLVHAVAGPSEGTFAEKDDAQGALEPFVSYDSASTFVRLGFLVAADAPLGPGLDRDKVASLRLNLGSHF
jgi:hypothetical protein